MHRDKIENILSAHPKWHKDFEMNNLTKLDYENLMKQCGIFEVVGYSVIFTIDHDVTISICQCDNDVVALFLVRILNAVKELMQTIEGGNA